MRAIVQRVSRASVTVEGQMVSQIGTGLLILLGVEELDTETDIEWLSRKIANLRIFGDANGAMNHSLLEIGGGAIVVSQFTLHASIKKGNRPSYLKAAKPMVAEPLYKAFVQRMEKEMGQKVGTGIFGADMKVDLLNDGPVTIFFDTKNKE
ncbi:MAG: D-aminoacyl-tRNA deacylase [Sediminicola sp.]